jgi:choline kinase
MENAIILAAGIGSRLGDITKHTPKCCLEVGGCSIISRIVKQINKASKSINITVVVGYNAEKIRKELDINLLKVDFVENVNYANTNNMVSCLMAIESIKNMYSNMYIINGDCIYDDKIIQKMIEAKSNAIAVDSSQYMDESMKVKIVNGAIKEISKSLPKCKNNITSIDFYKFDRHTTSSLGNIMKGYFNLGQLNSWTEVAIDQLFMNETIIVRPVYIDGLPWVEIDNFNDLALARKIWP